MSFHGTSMIFDGIACEEMGLVMYEFDNYRQDATKFTSNLAIQEDRIDGRFRSLFYGGAVNEPLVFKMILCVREDRVTKRESLDRWDLQKIAAWLTGHTEYKWLSIVQHDLQDVRFRCLCSELETIEVAGNAWGVACKVTCDSPFAYLIPKSYTFTATENKMAVGAILSESTHNDFYYPKLTVIPKTDGDLKVLITNGRESSIFCLRGVPASAGMVSIDCENAIVTAGSGANMYGYIDFSSGFHFPRFARGENIVSLSGAAEYTFTCEWPVNVGG